MKENTSHVYKPKTWNELTYKDRVAYSTSIASFALGWLLIFIALIMPPMGEIAPSAITVFGISLSYTGALLGVALYVKNATSEIKTEITDKVNAYLDRRFDGEGKPKKVEPENEFFVDEMGG